MLTSGGLGKGDVNQLEKKVGNPPGCPDLQLL